MSKVITLLAILFWNAACEDSPWNVTAKESLRDVSPRSTSWSSRRSSLAKESLAFPLISKHSSTASTDSEHDGHDKNFLTFNEFVAQHEQTAHTDSSEKPQNGSNSMRETPSQDPRVLNIHLVAHTHNDVGWLKTVDQYYHGLNNTIINTAVKYILTSTISALQANPSRTFTYVEMAFFTRWYTRQTPQTQSLVKSLVRNGQLHFANGGWCMHDEAATHYMGMIDQTTLGHNFLAEEFEGYSPTIGWQLDPFGHSVTQAKVMSFDMGFDALFFGRIDYQDLEKRRNESRCEGLWGEDSNGKDDNDGQQVFWGLTGSFNGNYQPPPTLNFDHGEEPFIEAFSLDERVSDFVNAAADQAQIVQGHNIMFTMGGDFKYHNAAETFDLMDDVIHFVNLYQQQNKIDIQALNRGSEPGRFTSLKVFYSTPDMYAKAKYEEALEWETKTDDFFPYANCEDCYWTGYFTSRPALKRMERVASSFLHMARQVESYRHVATLPDPKPPAGSTSSTSMWDSSPLFSLDAAVGLAQHHDGISGTSKQHVAYDYAWRLDKGIKEATSYVARLLENVLGMNMAENDDTTSDAPVKLVYCQDLNVTVCNITQAATMDVGTDLYIVAYNALASSTREDNILTLRIPVSIDATYEVSALIQDEDGGAISYYRLASVLVPSLVKAPSPAEHPAAYVLHIHVSPEELILFPPVGARVLCVRMVNTLPSALNPVPLHKRSLMETKIDETRRLRLDEEVDDNDIFEVKNGIMRVIFNTSTGLITGVYHEVNKNSGDKVVSPSSWEYMDLKQQWGYYPSYQADQGQKSGAYIFRPASPDQPLVDISKKEQNQQKKSISKRTIYESNLLTEVHVSVSPWVTQITRICHQSRFIEVEYTVGPIPDDDGVGKEVVARYETSVESQDVFFTDSNGREFVKRQRNVRPTWDLEVHQPIAGNYYPVNTAIFIQPECNNTDGDNNSGTSFGVLTDRTQGGTSLSSGAVELMVHRRIKVDDERGVHEPLDETDGGMTPYPPYGNATRHGKGLVVSGIHRLFVGGASAGAEEARRGMDGVFSPIQLFFAVAKVPSHERNKEDIGAGSVKKVSFSAIQATLPQNVMLLTFAAKPTPEKNNADIFLIRLGHQYGAGEGPLANPVQVDMSKLFPSNRQIDTIVEKTLSGNQDRSSWEEYRIRWGSKSRDKSRKISKTHVEKGFKSSGVNSAGEGCTLPAQDSDDKENFIIMRPMKICTFEVKLRPINVHQFTDKEKSVL